VPVVLPALLPTVPPLLWLPVLRCWTTVPVVLPALMPAVPPLLWLPVLRC
jgi:hypothetical protein